MMVNSVAHGQFLREQLEGGEAELLRRRGWKHRCSGPGAFWLWSKTIDGEQFQCSQSTALGIEGALEAFADPADPERVVYDNSLDRGIKPDSERRMGPPPDEETDPHEDGIREWCAPRDSHEPPLGSKFKIGGTDGS